MSRKKPTEKKPNGVFVPEILRDAILARLDDPDSAMRFPALMACLLPVYDGATLLRQAGKLTIAPEGAHWRVQLDLPGEVVTGRIACQSLTTLLDDLNLAIAEQRIAWAPGWTKNKKRLPTVDELIQ